RSGREFQKSVFAALAGQCRKPEHSRSAHPLPHSLGLTARERALPAGREKSKRLFKSQPVFHRASDQRRWPATGFPVDNFSKGGPAVPCGRGSGEFRYGGTPQKMAVHIVSLARATAPGRPSARTAARSSWLFNRWTSSYTMSGSDHCTHHVPM